MNSTTLVLPEEGEIIFARSATAGANAGKTYQALQNMINETAGKLSGQTVIAFEKPASFNGGVKLTTAGGLTLLTGSAPTAPGTNTPADPAVDYLIVYAKSDGALYTKLGTAGTEQAITARTFSKTFLFMGG